MTPRFNSPPPQLPGLIDQGAIASIYSAAGAVSAIHLYLYNYARPDDTNVTAWASSLYGHFKLLLPPGEGWPEEGVITPREGNVNRKRDAKGYPLQPSPPKRETPKEMLLKEEQWKRAARNSKRAEVGFGTFGVSLELQIGVTHVIPWTVVITENVVEHHKQTCSQSTFPTPRAGQEKEIPQATATGQCRQTDRLPKPHGQCRCGEQTCACAG